MQALVKQELSAEALAGILRVSPAAVRQHLDTLQAYGLVSRRKEVTRPNRPAFLYRLSPSGTRAFPKRYDLLLGLVVDVVLERDGPEAVDEILRASARRLAEHVRERFPGGDERRRWEILIGWLEDELAWRADVGEQDGRRRITIHQCPFHDVAQQYPRICGVFFGALIRALYGDVAVAQAPAPPAPACCALLVGP